jgi:carboxylesterase
LSLSVGAAARAAEAVRCTLDSRAGTLRPRRRTAGLTSKGNTMSDTTPSDDTAGNASAHPVIPGAEPFAAEGGPIGVLVLHGFTGNPQSMRGLAEALAAAGHTVELPLLPGHGTVVDDMVPTRWADWSSAAEEAYSALAARCEKVVVTGLSMGGALTLWLAEHHPEIAGIAVINALAEPPEGMVDLLQPLLDEGTATFPGIGSDIAKPDVVEAAYPETPVAALLSLMEAAADVRDGLGTITCPVLVLSSPEDHVVPPSSSDRIMSSVAGPVERVLLERSYHVATLDHDKDEIEQQVVAFTAKVTS